MFFLCYHGKGGWTHDSIGAMTLDDFNWNVRRLVEVIKEEREAEKKAHQRAASKAKGR